MVIAILVMALFLLDLAVPSAVFKRTSLMLDLVFVVCAAILAYLSWSTLKEQDKRG
jgi:hypothetical protein